MTNLATHEIKPWFVQVVGESGLKQLGYQCVCAERDEDGLVISRYALFYHEKNQKAWFWDIGDKSLNRVVMNCRSIKDFEFIRDALDFREKLTKNE